MQTWKDDEFLLGFKFSRVQTSRKGFHELFQWKFVTSGDVMYEQFMGDFTLYRDSASPQVQYSLIIILLYHTGREFSSDQPAPSLIFFH